jgi:hypothetical protein
MVGDEDEGVEEVAHHAVEGRVVREAPVTAARRTPQLLYIYILSVIFAARTLEFAKLWLKAGRGELNVMSS